MTLYFCNNEWAPIGIAAPESVVDAKRVAERICPGSSERWIEAHFNVDASRYLEPAFADERCTFCGQRSHETIAMMFGSDGTARICDDCVARFSRELNQQPPSPPKSG